MTQNEQSNRLTSKDLDFLRSVANNPETETMTSDKLRSQSCGDLRSEKRKKFGSVATVNSERVESKKFDFGLIACWRRLKVAFRGHDKSTSTK